MAKSKKKRNKKYSGAESTQVQRPVVHHYTAVQRSAAGQWLFDNKRRIRIIVIALVVVVAVGSILFEVVRLITG